MSVREGLVGVARRIDRKIFRRSVALLDRIGRLRGELEEARAEIEELRTVVLAYSAEVEQERRETRAQFLVIRGALIPPKDSESASEL